MSDELEIEPARLSAMIREAKAFQLVDVRTEQEHRIAAIAGGSLIPLQSLEARVAELDRSAPIILYCHHGGRSLAAAMALRDAGYQAVSLRGGIDRWAVEIDPSVRRY